MAFHGTYERRHPLFPSTDAVIGQFSFLEQMAPRLPDQLMKIVSGYWFRYRYKPICAYYGKSGSRGVTIPIKILIDAATLTQVNNFSASMMIHR